MTTAKIVQAATDVADQHGIAAVTMRRVAERLGVEAMSLYHHVGNKEELLDALVDSVMAQIKLPDTSSPWRQEMVLRAHSARTILGLHPWALGMLESRPNPGHALLRHHDRVIGCLRKNGFSVALATHAFSTLDAFIYGFVLTESSLPFRPEDGAERTFAERVAPSGEEYPHLVDSLTELFADATFSLSREFDIGLELILDGLEKRLVETRHGVEHGG